MNNCRDGPVDMPQLFIKSTKTESLIICVLISLLIFTGGYVFQSLSGYNSLNPSLTRTPFNPGLENSSPYKFSGNGAPGLNTTSTRLKYFPPEIRGEIQTLAGKYSLALNTWGFDPVNNEISLYAYGITDESVFRDLQGRQVGNYTIHIINYTEILNARDEVYIQLFQIQKKPEYQIAHISMMEDIFSDPREYTVELWVYNSTPENRKLDNMVMKGWKIQVYPVSPIPGNTSNSSKSR